MLLGIPTLDLSRLGSHGVATVLCTPMTARGSAKLSRKDHSLSREVVLKNRFTLVCMATAALALSACRSSVETLSTCVPSLSSGGIVAEVRDAGTNADISLGAWGRAVEDTYRDTLVAGAQGQLWSREARAGIYRVTIGRPGYQLWESAGIRVLGGACGVGGSTTLRVLLQPE